MPVTVGAVTVGSITVLDVGRSKPGRHRIASPLRDEGGFEGGTPKAHRNWIFPLREKLSLKVG